jgi:hypothetical protein
VGSTRRCSPHRRRPICRSVDPIARTSTPRGDQDPIG